MTDIPWEAFIGEWMDHMFARYFEPDNCAEWPEFFDCWVGELIDKCCYFYCIEFATLPAKEQSHFRNTLVRTGYRLNKKRDELPEEDIEVLEDLDILRTSEVLKREEEVLDA